MLDCLRTVLLVWLGLSHGNLLCSSTSQVCTLDSFRKHQAAKQHEQAVEKAAAKKAEALQAAQEEILQKQEPMLCNLLRTAFHTAKLKMVSSRTTARLPHAVHDLQTSCEGGWR